MATGTGVGYDSPAVAASFTKTWQGVAGLEQAIERGADHLLSLQFDPGYWLGELEADTTLESDYIYYLHVLGKAEPKRIAKLESNLE